MPFSAGGMPEQNQLSITALLLTEKHLCQLERRTGFLEGKCCDKSIFINSGFDYYFIIISFKFLHEEKKSKDITSTFTDF